MRVRLGKARKSCRFMMEPLEQRDLLTAAADAVVLSDDPQPASEIVIAADTTPPPVAAPAGLNITKTFSTSLILGWADQSASESGDRIERSTDNVIWETVGTVGPNVTSFQDVGLNPNATYYYRVVAFDFLSEFASDAITATTIPQSLQLDYNSNGLSNISYNGATLLDVSTSPQDGFSIFDYTIIKPDGTRTVAPGGGGFTSSWDLNTHTLTYEYKWGRIATQYVQDVDRLNLVITVTNKSTLNTIAGMSILPFIVHFPEFPTGFYSDSPVAGNNLEGPTVIPADWHTGELALVNDDVVKPLNVGFLTYPQSVDHKYLFWVGSTPFWCQPGNWPRFDRPIAPGGVDRYTVSVRFSPTGTTAEQIAPDVYASALAQFPFENNWNDRRPIGFIHLANSSISGKSVRNPRGYFDGNFDVRTKLGREIFRKTLMHWANTSITILKNMNAQGMIVWDLEGEQYPIINYVGDPRMLSTLAPEMEYRGAVDAYFKKFRDAGLRIGLTVRAQRLKLTSKGWRQVPVKNPYSQLAAKIEYARTRWGATLFYIDSNAFKSIYDASVFKKLLATYPDILLIPEHETTRYYAYSAPYKELRMGEVSTPDSALSAYPTSFSAINTSAGDFVAYHDQLIAAVRRGDILLFPAWFDDPANASVKAIYDEATGALAP